MSTPFMGQIEIFSFNFAPKGWSLCNGQLLPINQNQALFTLGEKGGSEAVTINQSSMPAHTHSLQGDSNAGTVNTPASNTVLGVGNGTQNPGTPFVISIYGNPQPSGTLAPQTIGNTGGNQAHTNLMPYLCLNMCIALQGIFPSQT